MKGLPQLSHTPARGEFGETLHNPAPARAADVFGHALDRLMRANRRTPCGDPDDWPLWTSEDPSDRAEAAERCQPCPLLTLCAAVVDEEQPTFGAWAGRDIPKRK